MLSVVNDLSLVISRWQWKVYGASLLTGSRAILMESPLGHAHDCYRRRECRIGIVTVLFTEHRIDHGPVGNACSRGKCTVCEFVRVCAGADSKICLI